MRTTRAVRTPVESCAHPRRTTNVSVGLKRTVCDSCGHVNFEWVSTLLESKVEQVEGFGSSVAQA